jgi:hypothetical protein
MVVISAVHTLPISDIRVAGIDTDLRRRVVAQVGMIVGAVSAQKVDVDWADSAVRPLPMGHQ